MRLVESRDRHCRNREYSIVAGSRKKINSRNADYDYKKEMKQKREIVYSIDVSVQKGAAAENKPLDLVNLSRLNKKLNQNDLFPAAGRREFANYG